MSQFNVRKAIFTLQRYDDTTITVEMTGKLIRSKYLRRWIPIYLNPEKIINNWGRVGLIKVNSRTFINIDQIKSISYKTSEFIIEK